MATDENTNPGNEAQAQPAPESTPADQGEEDLGQFLPIRPKRRRSRLHRDRGVGTRVSRRRSRWRCGPTPGGYRFGQSLDDISEVPPAEAPEAPPPEVPEAPPAETPAVAPLDIDFQAFDLPELSVPSVNSPEAEPPAEIEESRQRRRNRRSISSICLLFFEVFCFIMAYVFMLFFKLVGYTGGSVDRR